MGIIRLVQISFWLTVLNEFAAIDLCGDIRSNVHSGVIKLPDLSGQLVEDLNCTWMYSAPPGHKLLVKVDSVQLPPPHIRTSSLQLFIDDQLFEIPRNCVKCLREIVGGHTIKATFLSTLAPFSVANMSLDSDFVLSVQTVGSFQVRYKSFDPYVCEKPKPPDNGYVIDKGWKLYQEIFYHCNPPYDLIGDSSATCNIPADNPVPDWSAQPPKCTIRNCSQGIIHREAGAGAIANPGYPTRILVPPLPCQWEIETKSGNVQATLTYLRLPPSRRKSERTTRLVLYDGDIATPIRPLTEDYSQPFNFTTKSRKLIVQYSSSAENKEGGKLGFYLEYNAVKSSCSDPGPPINGEIVVYSLTVGSVVSYRCLPRFVLIGESLSECLSNGRWSAPKPSCKGPVSAFSDTLMTASNSTDTVVGNFTEQPVPSKPTAVPKKKPVLIVTKKPSVTPKEKPTGTKRKPKPTAEEPMEGKPEDERRIKNNGGPKSEPHLQQVIPPKEPGKPSEHQQLEEGGSIHQETNLLPTNKEDGIKVGEEDDDAKMSVTMIIIIVGVAGPVAIILILLVVVIIYRKRYPVRMRFGRKFSTFENPMYIKKDATHPRELRRLTT